MRYNVTEGEQQMETWKAIVGYEGLYEVSDLGNVRSLVQRSNRWKPGIRKLTKNRDGYLLVMLSKDGKHKLMLVHRLVASAFIPNPQGLETVNHKDENKLNNAANNLEWMSAADNTAYSQPQRAEHPVQQLDKSTGEVLAMYPSTHEAERVTGIAHPNICFCCQGKYKSSGGFGWRYV